MLVTLILSIGIAVPLGVAAAWKAGSLIDRLVMVFAVFGFSVPVFVIAYLLAYVFALELDWLPVQGYTPISHGFWPWLQNLILPVDRARRRLHRADRAHDARLHARGVAAGLHQDGARQGHRPRRHPLRARA